MTAFLIILILLFILELVYFRIAEHCNIIDRPNERSSHRRIVLRGGGIIFTVALWIWCAVYGFHYPWLLAGVTLAAGISFVDDIRSLPDSVRLVVQFLAMFLVFKEAGLLQWEMWPYLLPALIVCVGAVNIYNFMDGINGITGVYSMAVLIPLYIKNEVLMAQGGEGFVEPSFLIVTGLSLMVFLWFNFRTKARCFAGDVGSVGIALLLLFAIGRLVMLTGDVTWLMLMLVYGVDGCLTIIHRIMLHEHLGEAHRKHAYQLMANELGMRHTTVSLIYGLTQLALSLALIYLVPDDMAAHWAFLFVCLAVLCLIYVAFMRRFYHLHETYLKRIMK